MEEPGLPRRSRLAQSSWSTCCSQARLRPWLEPGTGAHWRHARGGFLSTTLILTRAGLSRSTAASQMSRSSIRVAHTPLSHTGPPDRRPSHRSACTRGIKSLSGAPTKDRKSELPMGYGDERHNDRRRDYLGYRGSRRSDRLPRVHFTPENGSQGSSRVRNGSARRKVLPRVQLRPLLGRNGEPGDVSIGRSRIAAGPSALTTRPHYTNPRNGPAAPRCNQFSAG